MSTDIVPVTSGMRIPSLQQVELMTDSDGGVKFIATGDLGHNRFAGTSCGPDSALHEDPSSLQEEDDAEDAHSWAILAGSSFLLVILVVAFFMVIRGMMPQELMSDYMQEQYSPLQMSLPSRQVNRFADASAASSVHDLDVSILQEELTAMSKRTEELIAVVNAHGDKLLTLQANSDNKVDEEKKCLPENDWAPSSLIDDEHTSPRHGRKPGQWFPWFTTVPLSAPHGPEITLAVGPVQRTFCYPFLVPGQIQLRLPHPIKVTGWGVTTLMSDSQPKRIRAVALPSGDDLGTLDVDRRKSSTKQTVTVPSEADTQLIRFLIDTSFGASYCCLYRIHVFG